MARQNKGERIENFRISVSDDNSHKQIWVHKFTRLSLTVTIVTLVVIVVAVLYSLIAFTPIRTTIPGYPDAVTRRAAIQTAIRVDSLERLIARWELYSENLSRIVANREPIPLDSIIRVTSGDFLALRDASELAGRDSLLRKMVVEEEQFEVSDGASRKMPIEGIHFFTPLKGVVSQPYDPVLHPYLDITAPANSVVMSVLDGTVIFSGWNDEAGYTIQIQHDGDLVSIYKHNQKLLKNTGDRVVAGTPVALVGNTGRLTTGDHLHFELWFKGEAIDPTKYINF